MMLSHVRRRISAGPVQLLLAAVLLIPLLAFGSPPGPGAAMMTVHGTVMAIGHPMPDVKVVIHAWPDQAIVQALKPGQKVPWVLVGTATTAADGTFSVAMPLAKLMPEASYGVVNLEADTTTAMFGFPVVVTKTPGNAYLAGSHPVVHLISTPRDDHGCGGIGQWIYLKPLGKHYATVGETYVAASHATQHFTYAKGQSSSLGWGVSASAKYASWSQNGTYSWSSSFKETWPTYGANRSVWYTTAFKWAKYGCRTISGGYAFYGQHASGYAGGADIKKPTFIPPTPRRFCVKQISGSSPTSNNSSAVMWTAKVEVKAVKDDAALGFEASAETGFDTSAQITYTVSRTRYLCGWKSLPGGTPRQLVIRR